MSDEKQTTEEDLVMDSPRVIMSQELEELLSFEQINDLNPSMGVRITSSGSEDSFDCKFRSFSKSGKKMTYHLEVETREPAAFLRAVNSHKEKFSIEVDDRIRFKVIDCQLSNWDVFKDTDSFVVGLGVQGEVQF